MSTNENEFLKIETFVLKVHMNCQGCVNKVRKVLRKIEGVYEVDINAEEHKVIVTGIVNPSTLIQKMAKLGKHAEILSTGYNQEQGNHAEDNNHSEEYIIINGPNAFENQYMVPNFFGKDHWQPEWHFNHDMEKYLAKPAPFYESVNNSNNQNFTLINENPIWQEKVIPMTWPTSFQENNEKNYLESQEWAHNQIGGPSFSEYRNQPYLMANLPTYYYNCRPQPSNTMQPSFYNPLAHGINIQEAPTRNHKYFSYPFSFY